MVGIERADQIPFLFIDAPGLHGLYASRRSHVHQVFKFRTRLAGAQRPERDANLLVCHGCLAMTYRTYLSYRSYLWPQRFKNVSTSFSRYVRASARPEFSVHPAA